MNAGKKNLPGVISDIFTYHGGIVEITGEERAEYIIPPSLGEILAIPEHGRLKFVYADDDGDAVDASYDSDFFTLIERLFAEKGKISVVSYPPYMPGIDKIAKNIANNLTFANATFRQESPENSTLSYILTYFKYMAISDERQEGIVAVLLNEKNHANIDIVKEHGIIDTLEVDHREISTKNTRQVLENSYLAALLQTKDKLANFIKSLERRLNRDISRVYEYYETMKAEIRKTMAKKSVATKNVKTKEEEKKSIAIKKQVIDKLAAIEAEKQWKIDDLIGKYALKIQIEPVTMVRIITSSIIFWIDIKRRLATRKFPLTYNPITRQLDPLPCESCFYPKGVRYICDDKLHIICDSCFKQCSRCQKRFCRACKDECPKCKKK